MVVGLFTSVNDGGIAQFTIQMLRVLSDDLNIDVKAFLPDNCKTTIPEDLQKKVVRYPKWRTIIPYASGINRLAHIIRKSHFDIIWFMDNAILSDQLAFRIKGQTDYYLTIHDVNLHPSNSNSIVQKMHNLYLKCVTGYAEHYAKKVVLLSPNCMDTYKQRHGNSNRYMLMNLGAHIPECSSVRPNEIDENINCYYLFFGRIDKYKGLSTLFKAYQEYDSHRYPLVVAGAGKLSDEENADKKKLEDAIIINRFIKDEEMLWLFSHARALILPYIEASQSGIIPIAYHYGIPVIVSTVAGLTQFVVDKKTGYVCWSLNEYVNAMNNLEDNEVWEEMHKNCISYYKENMDWEENIRNIIEC